MGRSTDFWRKVLRLDNKEVEVAKSGDNYYAQVKVSGETVLAIVQPPESYDGKTGGGGEVSVFDASGKLQVDRSKAIKYGEPIILFNPNNNAGLQIQNAISETKDLLPEALKNAQDIKVDIEKLDEGHAINVHNENRVAVGSSTVVQINKDSTVSVINSPKVDEGDRETLKAFLQFMVIALEGKQQTYRANIMVLDPRDNMLKIAAHYNMEGKIDRNISFPSTAGCAGDALQNDSVAFFDVRTTPHKKFDIEPERIWRDLKSITSIPIHDTSGNRLGVLNMDSDNNIDKTKFLSSDFQDAMWLAADAFGTFLEKRV